jgi:hypothetical protein
MVLKIKPVLSVYVLMVLKIYVHLLMNKLTSKLFTFFQEIIVLTNSEDHLNNLHQGIFWP